MEAVTALIIDDEPHARERLRDLLARRSDIRVIGECGDGSSAVTAIRRSRPELILLDVQMPELDGFGVLAHLRPREMPVTVFVTAYNQHALRAFDMGAVDYVLKPIVAARFELAIDRATQRVRERSVSPSSQIKPVLESAAPDGPWLERLIVERRGRMLIVPVWSVHWLEAAGNYVRVHGQDGSNLMRATLRVLETRLDPRLFYRIHRSAIVALGSVADVRPGSHGDADVILRDGTELHASRARGRELRLRLRR